MCFLTLTNSCSLASICFYKKRNSYIILKKSPQRSKANCDNDVSFFFVFVNDCFVFASTVSSSGYYIFADTFFILWKIIIEEIVDQQGDIYIPK